MSIAIDKKSSRGRPRADTELVTGRLARPVLDAMDNWIAAQPEPKPTRSDVMRLALREWLDRRA